MDTLCGSGGGWTRIGFLNMSDYRQQCHDNWEEYNKDTGGIRTCRRRSTRGNTCDSAYISSLDIQYSEICGRAVGYQYGSPDAVHPSGNNKYIDRAYADGVSITLGAYRQHVWTLMVGYNANSDRSHNSQCPCHQYSRQTVESFIGNDYYCESGNELYRRCPTQPYTCLIPLWDGKECDPYERYCCERKLVNLSCHGFTKSSQEKQMNTSRYVFAVMKVETMKIL